MLPFAFPNLPEVALPTDSAPLRRTPLFAEHRRLGARLVPFAGWEMPVEYAGIVAEHLAVRRAAGLFDVSHMGEIEVSGPGALPLLQFVACNDAARLAVGQAHYSGLMNAAGGFVDDLVVHKLAEDDFLLVVNAANHAADLEHIRAHNRFAARVEDRADVYAQLALQGPRALELLQPLVAFPLAPLRYYWFARGEVMGAPALVARTGYTGEDGFEIYVPPAAAEPLWRALLAAGGPAGLLPCGLGARNTLRLEAGMALYGHEIDATTTPWEANLGWICKLDRAPGAIPLLADAALRAARGNFSRRLLGFEMTDPGVARDGYAVLDAAGAGIGRVTSGSPLPGAARNIGLAYAPPARAPGAEIWIQIRQRPARARVVTLPFYRRGAPRAGAPAQPVS